MPMDVPPMCICLLNAMTPIKTHKNPKRCKAVDLASNGEHLYQCSLLIYDGYFILYADIPGFFG